MKISPAARKHAQKLRSKKKGPRGKAIPHDEELGDIFSDLLGGLPIIGGLFGGGQKAPAPGAPAPAGGAAGPAPGMMGLPMPGGLGATIEQIRNVVQDALAGNRDIVERMQLQAAGGAERLQKATEAVTQAISPQLAQARGGVQVQRLQTQATSEHRGLQQRAERDRLSSSRHAELLAKLTEIARTATTLQTRLGGGAAVITDPTTRAILNVR